MPHSVLGIVGRLIVTTMAVFLVNSFITVPIPRRGLAGRGFYSLVDEIQVLELSLVTAVAVYLIGSMFLRLTKSRAALASAGGVSINLGLLIVDVRMHRYHATVEAIIAERYGPAWVLWLEATVLVIGGTVALISASRRGVPTVDRAQAASRK